MPDTAPTSVAGAKPVAGVSATSAAYRRMNLPNRLSLARIFAIPFFIFFLYGGDIFGLEEGHLVNGICRTLALLLTIAVTITDWLDGKIARDHGIVTNLGKLLDPLADKIFVTAALVSMVDLNLVPFWAVILIVGREFLITGLRSIAQGAGRILPADRIGKHKMGWQLGLIITAITVIAARDFLLTAGVWNTPLVEQYRADLIITVMIWIPLVVTLVLTVWSAVHYLRVNYDLLRGQL
jgi:CDP-diacylglycerol--glycerol-3-phosphate 3-phosphatidyltransferase